MATDIIARGIAASVVSQVSADKQAVSEDRDAVEAAKTEVLNVAESIPEDYSTLSADVSELKEESTERLLAVNERFSMVEDASFIKQSLPDYIFTFMHISTNGSLAANNNKNICFKNAIFAKKGLKISVDSGMNNN